MTTLLPTIVVGMTITNGRPVMMLIPVFVVMVMVMGNASMMPAQCSGENGGITWFSNRQGTESDQIWHPGKAQIRHTMQVRVMTSDFGL